MDLHRNFGLSHNSISLVVKQRKVPLPPFTESYHNGRWDIYWEKPRSLIVIIVQTVIHNGALCMLVRFSSVNFHFLFTHRIEESETLFLAL